MSPPTTGGLAVCLLAMALAGCSRSSEEARLRHVAAQSGSSNPTPLADDPAADMVNAVSSGDNKSPVFLKFRLVTAPQVGKPLELQVALIQEPKLEIDSLKVWLQPRDGLQLKSAPSTDFGKPAIGELHMIPVTLVPQQAGVLSLGVTVLVDTEHDSITRGFTVPVLVMAPSAAAGDAPAAAPAAAPGATRAAPGAHANPR